MNRTSIKKHFSFVTHPNKKTKAHSFMINNILLNNIYIKDYNNSGLDNFV